MLLVETLEKWLIQVKKSGSRKMWKIWLIHHFTHRRIKKMNEDDLFHIYSLWGQKFVWFVESYYNNPDSVIKIIHLGIMVGLTDFVRRWKLSWWVLIPGVLIFGAVKCLKEVKSRFWFSSKMRFWCALFSSEISDHVSNCNFGAFSNDSNYGFFHLIGVWNCMIHTVSITNQMRETAPKTLVWII